MKPAVLIIVTSDPRTSARAAEAVRIAAGISPWQKADVALYLRGAATLALREFPDDLMDEEIFRRHLPDFAASGRPVYVQKDATWLKNLAGSPMKFEAITDAQLATFAAQSQYVLRF